MKYRKLLVPEIGKVTMVEEEWNGKISGPNDVIIRNHFSHISAGSELAAIDGLESWFNIPGTPGYTAVGEVLEIGEDVDHVIPGDLVYTYGPHAEMYKIDATDRWHGVCVKLPEGVRSDHASFTHMAGIAMTAIRNSNIELGDDVAVTGMGAIGILAAQLAQLQGARVIATDPEPTRREMAKQCGIMHVLDPILPDLKDQIMSMTNEQGVSTLIDASGMSKVIEQSIDFVALYGEVILLGTPRSPYETNLTGVLQHFHLLPHCLTMKGALEFIFPTHQMEFLKHSIERNASVILGLIKSGKLLIGPIHSHTMKPSDAQAAYDGLRNKKNEFIGVVFDWLSFR
ncbi:MAG: zinc-binding dehydrogenase [Bacteroidales bacterium]|nr:zinc-binding dehydrogenase [Bacteroidales bacterium]